MPKLPITPIEWIVLVIIGIISLLTVASIGLTIWLICHVVNSPAANQVLGC